MTDRNGRPHRWQTTRAPVTTTSPTGAKAGVPSARTATTGRGARAARRRAGAGAGPGGAGASARAGSRAGPRAADTTVFISADMTSPPG